MTSSMKCEVCVFDLVFGVDFSVCTENSFDEISRNRSSWQNNPMAAAPKGSHYNNCFFFVICFLLSFLLQNINKGGT